MNYEHGAPIPDGVILKLIHLTGASYSWLTTGKGPKYPRRGRE
jgi:hypothetical protein